MLRLVKKFFYMLKKIAPSINGNPRDKAEDYVEDQINQKINDIDKTADCNKINENYNKAKNALGLGFKEEEIDWVSFKEQVESSSQAQEQEEFVGDLISKGLDFLNSMKRELEKQKDNLLAEIRKYTSWV